MDHLYHFFPDHDDCETNFLSRTERVPFMVEKDFHNYSPEDFYGITALQLERLQMEGPEAIIRIQSIQTIPQFLQSWLFFALLSLFLDVDIDALTFKDKQSLHVTTGSLPRYLQVWKEKVNMENQEEKTQRSVSVDTALNDASRFVSKWSQRVVSCEVPQNLWLSFAILGETLNYARLKVLPPNKAEGWQSPDVKQWGKSEFIKCALEKKGWCPSTIRNLQRSVGNLSGLFVISLLQAPKGSHQSCTDRECIAHSKDDTKFPLHTNECKERIRDESSYSCHSLCVEEGAVSNMLQEGYIPLVSLARRSDRDKGIPRVKVRAYYLSESHPIHEKPSRKWPNYVAISHVWSDGLGNKRENALPQCQFLKLQKMVNKLQKNEEMRDDSPFWLDTFCIPISPKLRNMGIRGMKQAYENAHQVLVLDNDLQEFGQHNGLEPLMRINTSKWVTRLWTLQEGSLAKNLFFAFEHGMTLNIRVLEDRLKKAEKNTHLCWLETAQIFNPTIKSLRNPDEKNKVVHLWNAVQRRKTSKDTDETVCLSTLLGIDPGPLLDSTGTTEQKMCTFLILLDIHVGIPSGMVFLPGSRLDKEGFGWAPKTWMSGQGENFPYPLSLGGSPPSYLTRRGLLVEYPGIDLAFTSAPKEKVFWFTPDRNLSQWYRVERITQSHSSWPEVDGQKFAIILCRSKMSSFPEIALLVSVMNVRDEVMWVHCCSRVWISLESNQSEIDKVVDRFKTKKERVMGEALPTSQKWCVDKAMVRYHIYQVDTPCLHIILGSTYYTPVYFEFYTSSPTPEYSKRSCSSYSAEEP